MFSWIICLIFFLFELFLRSATGTYATEIMGAYSLTKNGFSVFVGIYFISFGFMQIPAGLLVDRYGVKKLLLLSAFCSVLGTFLLAVSDQFYLALMARFIIGFSSSFIFLCLLMTIKHHFPKRFRGFFMGFSQSFGALGPLIAGAPLAQSQASWQHVMLICSLLALILFILFFFTDFLKPQIKKRQKTINPMKYVSIFMYSGSVYVALPMLSFFWGTLFFQDKGLSKELAAFLISFCWIGLAVGCPLLGKISDSIGQKKPVFLLASSLGIIASFLIVFAPAMPLLLGSLCFLLGIACSGQSLGFTYLADHAPEGHSGYLFGINNTGITTFDFIFPPLAGLVITRYGNFQLGLVIMPLLFLFSFLCAWLFVPSEKKAEAFKTRVM